jgi:hypothetical protein
MDRLPSPLMLGVVQWLVVSGEAWKTEKNP